MGIVVRVPTSGDVSTNVDFQNFVRGHQQVASRLGYEHALMAADVRAMLKDLDRASGQKRRYKVARPLAFAAASLALASVQIGLAHKRFIALYADELRGSRRRTTRRNMRIV